MFQISPMGTQANLKYIFDQSDYMLCLSYVIILNTPLNFVLGITEQ